MYCLRGLVDGDSDKAVMYLLDALAEELSDLGVDYADARDMVEYLFENDFLDLEQLERQFSEIANDNDND